MPDTINYEGGFPLRLKDNGDGTFSPAVAINGSGGLPTSTGWGPLVNGDQVAVLDSGLVGDGEVLGLHVVTMATGGSIAVEISADPNVATANWVAVRAFNMNTAADVGPAVTTAGYFVYNVAGAFRWRVRQTARTSGTTVGFCVITMGAATAVRQVTVGGAVQLVAGTAAIGTASLTPAAGSGGLALSSRIASAAAGTNGTIAKAAQGRLFKARAYNATAALRYLKFYNKATAPTVGTDAVILSVALKPNDTTEIDFGAIGYYFSTGIVYALTVGAADNDTAALTAGDVTGVNVIYA